MAVSVAGPRLRVARTHDETGRLLPEFVTNIGAERAEAKPERKRGSALINIAVGLLFALAIGLYVVSIAAQYRYVMTEKHNDLVAWIEAVSLDGGMAVASLLALGLSRAGMSARIERLFVVACALGSAAMNLAAANTTDIRSVLAYVGPPLFLAAVVDRAVSVVRRHYLGDSDASAWSSLGRIFLYLARFAVAPWSTVAGARRWVLASAPVPESPKAVHVEAVQVIETRTLPWPPEIVGPVSAVPPKAVPPKRPKPAKAVAPKPATAPRTGTKTADLIRIATERHGELAAIPLESCSKIATGIAGEIEMHAGSARTALLKAARSARNGGAK